MIIRFLLISLLLTSAAFAIDDKFADALDKNLKIPSKNSEKFQDTPLRDGNCTLPRAKNVVYHDNLVKTTLSGKNFEMPETNLDYDYSDNKYTVIKVRPVGVIRTNKDFRDGDIVKFKVVDDAFYEEKLILPKNSEISAVIENISPNGKMGVPANIVISRFSSPLVENKTLDCTLNRQGANRSLWVYPASYVLMPFFGVGFPMTFIRGGNVIIKPSEVIEVYYRPTRFRKSL